MNQCVTQAGVQERPLKGRLRVVASNQSINVEKRGCLGNQTDQASIQAFFEKRDKHGQPSDDISSPTFARD